MCNHFSVSLTPRITKGNYYMERIRWHLKESSTCHWRWHCSSQAYRWFAISFSLLILSFLIRCRQLIHLEALLSAWMRLHDFSYSLSDLWSKNSKVAFTSFSLSSIPWLCHNSYKSLLLHEWPRWKCCSISVRKHGCTGSHFCVRIEWPLWCIVFWSTRCLSCPIVHQERHCSQGFVPSDISSLWNSFSC